MEDIEFGAATAGRIEPKPAQDLTASECWQLACKYIASRTLIRKNKDFLLGFGAARNEIGRGRYGVTLRANNGRSATVDALQEVGDGLAYLSQAIEDAGHVNPRRLDLERAREHLIDAADILIWNLREVPPTSAATQDANQPTLDQVKAALVGWGL